MLSLLKKNTESAAPEHRPWHPNFRNAVALPDTKVIRTTFFINALTGLAALALLVLVGSQEYTLAELRSQISDLDRQIEHDRKPSQDAVTLFSQYQAQEKKILEVDAFIASNKLVVSRFLHSIGKSIPPKISITTLDYSSTGVNLRGLVIGTPEQASGMISAYEKQLKADEEIGKRFDTISLTNLSRDAQNGRLAFEITLRSTPPKEAKKR